MDKIDKVVGRAVKDEAAVNKVVDELLGEADNNLGDITFDSVKLYLKPEPKLYVQVDGPDLGDYKDYKKEKKAAVTFVKNLVQSLKDQVDISELEFEALSFSKVIVSGDVKKLRKLRTLLSQKETEEVKRRPAMRKEVRSLGLDIKRNIYNKEMEQFVSKHSGLASTAKLKHTFEVPWYQQWLDTEITGFDAADYVDNPTKLTNMLVDQAVKVEEMPDYRKGALLPENPKLVRDLKRAYKNVLSAVKKANDKLSGSYGGNFFYGLASWIRDWDWS